MMAYLTNESGADEPLTVRPDIAMSVLISADSIAGWSWLLTMRIGSADTMTTSSEGWGWLSADDAASWADLIAADIAMITDATAEVICFNEASDAEAVSSDSDIESRRLQWQRAEHLTSEQMIDLTDERELNKKMTKLQNTE